MIRHSSAASSPTGVTGGEEAQSSITYLTFRSHPPDEKLCSKALSFC